MPLYRLQVSLFIAGGLPRDEIVNTFYLNDHGVTTDPENLASSACGVWNSARTFPSNINRIRCRVYNMGDTPPREPVANEEMVHAGAQVSGPREVALCLSYYADQNVGRRRGRMYIGPYAATELAERPPASLRNDLVEIANGISALGGLDVDWVQYSPTTEENHEVTNFWIDDEWDTIRSRGLKATTRTTGTVDEG